jgi:hypothetical protein
VRSGKKQLTFNLFPLRSKGLARVLNRLLQAENCGFLLLEGLAKILVRDTELVELPVKPRDFFVPLLEGCLRPFECDALLLESALGLFPHQTLALKGGPSLSKGSPLLLELSVRLLACVPLPLKLLLHRGERGGLVCQAGPQLLGLLGPFLGLALPRSCSLEGSTALFELGTK